MVQCLQTFNFCYLNFLTNEAKHCLVYLTNQHRSCKHSVVSTAAVTVKLANISLSRVLVRCIKTVNEKERSAWFFSDIATLINVNFTFWLWSVIVPLLITCH